jgi:hypothetical protein
MVDRAPVEKVEDIRAALFEMGNQTAALEQAFKEWEATAFTPEGPPDFITVRAGLASLNYFAAMMMEDVLNWCAANTPPREPIYQRVVLSSDTEPARRYNLKYGERVTAYVEGRPIQIELA